MQNRTEEIAKQYESLGLSVIPIKKNGKAPAIPTWKEYQTRKPSDIEMHQWFSTDENNIAIVCGSISQNLIVVDVDDPDHEDFKKLRLPATPTVKTSKGFHYYYLGTPEKVLGNKKYVWGDIKSEGGYVVAPPSIHASGIEYEWITGIPEDINEFADFPYDQFELEENQKNKLYVEGLAGEIKEGTRNDTVTSMCGKLVALHDQKDWESIVYPLLVSFNKDKCKPPLPESELRTIFESICSKELSSNTPADFRIYSGEEMQKIEVKEFPYVVDKIIPEHAITAISAGTGAGKSLFMLILVQYIAQGIFVFDTYKSKKKKVLVLDQEMDGDLIASRYQEIVPKGVEVDFLFEQQWSIDRDPDLVWLKETITKNNYGLIVFDTLTTIHSKNENDAGEMRDLNKLLLDLIQETGVTIVYLHHHRKAYMGEKTSNASARGSTEIIAKAASHLVIKSSRDVDSDGQTVTTMEVTQEKARRPESISGFSLVVTYNPNWGGGTTWEFVEELLESMSAQDKAETEILNLLSKEGRPLPIKEIQDAIGFGSNNTRDACKSLVDHGLIFGEKVEGGGNAIYYSMKDQ